MDQNNKLVDNTQASNGSKTNTNNASENTENQLKFLGDRLGSRLSRIFSSNKPAGYALIIIIVMVFYMSIFFVNPILITTGRQLKDINRYYAKRLSNRMMITIASPIRHGFTDVIYKRIQQQLIDHLNVNRSAADNYNCQKKLIPTMQNGGDLSMQYGICDPESIFDGLDGDTKQSVDFLGFLYANHKDPINHPQLDKARLSIIDQFQHEYDYSLRSMFVGEQVLRGGRGLQRINRYRWQARADVELRSYFTQINHYIMYYDIIVDETYYSTPFNGAGDNCDGLAAAQPSEPTKDIVFTQPDGSTMICGQGLADCQPLGVVDKDGVLQPFGSDPYKAACGTDPYCGQGATGAGQINGANCGSDAGVELTCSGLPNGATFVGSIRPPNFRTRRGCASANTGKIGITTVDPDGYTFTVTTKLVSIGSTFN
ncbi:MAG: hypothetical protein WAQ98_16145 [Blastocatellia bacterium]